MGAETLTATGTLTVRVAGALQSGTYAILKGSGLAMPSTCTLVSDVTTPANFHQAWALEGDTLSVTLTVLPAEGQTLTQEIGGAATWSGQVKAATGDTLTLNVKDKATLTTDSPIVLRGLTLNDASTDGTASLTLSGDRPNLAAAATAINVDTDARAGVQSLGAVTISYGKTLTLASDAFDTLSGVGALVLDGLDTLPDAKAVSVAQFAAAGNTVTLRNGSNLQKAGGAMIAEATTNAGHLIVESGASTLALRDNFTSIIVKGGATANLKLRDYGGWGAFAGATLKLIVEEGASVVAQRVGEEPAWGCFEAQMVLNNGATVTGGDTPTHSLNFWHPGSADTPNILLEQGSATYGGTLWTQNGAFTKVGPGLLKLTAANTEGTNEVIIAEGACEVEAADATKNIGVGNNRTLRVKEGATLDLRIQDATGYNNGNASVIALEGGTMRVFERDSSANQFHLTGGTVRMMKGAENGNRGYDFWNATQNLVKVLAVSGASVANPTVSRFTYEEGASEADRKMDLRCGELVFDVAANARMEVATTLVSEVNKSGNDRCTMVTKRGAGELLFKAAPKYDQPTTVEGGTLRLAEGVSFPNGGLTLANGATFDGSLTVASGKTFGGEGTVTGSVTLADGVTLRATPGALTVWGKMAYEGLVNLEIALPTRPGRDGFRIPFPGGKKPTSIGNTSFIIAGVPTDDLELKETDNGWEVSAPDRAALERATLLHRFDFEETMSHTGTAIAPVDKGVSAHARPVPTDITSCDMLQATGTKTIGEGEAAKEVNLFRFGKAGMKVQEGGVNSDGFRLFNAQGLGCGADTGFTLSFHALMGTPAAKTGPISFALGKPGDDPANGWNIRLTDNGNDYTIYAYRANGGSEGYGVWQEQNATKMKLPYSTTAWTHYALVARPGTEHLTLDLYVNGTKQNTLVFDGSRNGTPIPMEGLVLTELVVGRSRAGDAPTDGNNASYQANPTETYLDEVALFDRALPAPGIA